MASLAHTRAGVPDALVTSGAIYWLITHLHNREHSQLRMAAAICLGYLTYNRNAHRLLLSACRNTPGLYDTLMKHLKKMDVEAKISPEFVEAFKVTKAAGLPSQALQANGGPPVQMKDPEYLKYILGMQPMGRSHSRSHERNQSRAWTSYGEYKIQGSGEEQKPKVKSPKIGVKSASIQSHQDLESEGSTLSAFKLPTLTDNKSTVQLELHNIFEAHKKRIQVLTPK